MEQLPDLQRLLRLHYPTGPSWTAPEMKDISYAPKYHQGNEFILTGYRPELLSFVRCFYSLGYAHNELGNIWTHLIGACFFAAFGAHIVADIGTINDPAHQVRSRSLCLLPHPLYLRMPTFRAACCVFSQAATMFFPLPDHLRLVMPKTGPNHA